MKREKGKTGKTCSALKNKIAGGLKGNRLLALFKWFRGNQWWPANPDCCHNTLPYAERWVLEFRSLSRGKRASLNTIQLLGVG